MEDAELNAMWAVYEALKDLDEPARQRALSWAVDRLELKVTPGRGSTGETDSAGEEAQFSDLAELIDAAQPSGGPDHALVVGYWVQVVEGKDGWSGNEVNSHLRNIGHGAANITTTLDRLIKRKPSLVMQTGKAGKGTTAKKTYKLTMNGLKSVREMIANTSGGGAR